MYDFIHAFRVPEIVFGWKVERRIVVLGVGALVDFVMFKIHDCGGACWSGMGGRKR